MLDAASTPEGEALDSMDLFDFELEALLLPADDEAEASGDSGLELWIAERRSRERRFERNGTKQAASGDGSPVYSLKVRRSGDRGWMHFSALSADDLEGEDFQRANAQGHLMDNEYQLVRERADALRPIQKGTYRRPKGPREGPTHIRNYRPEMPNHIGGPNIGQIVEGISYGTANSAWRDLGFPFPGHEEDLFWQGATIIEATDDSSVRVLDRRGNELSGDCAKLAMAEALYSDDLTPRYERDHGSRAPQTRKKLPFRDETYLRKKQPKDAYMAGDKRDNPGHERGPPIDMPSKDGSVWCIPSTFSGGSRTPSAWAVGAAATRISRSEPYERSPGFGEQKAEYKK